jgi:cyclase
MLGGMILSFMFVAATLLAPQPSAPEDAYDVVKFADGVYGFVWREQPFHPEPNVLIVINDEDVLVVDSSMLPSTARTIIGEIRKLTPKPVRYLVNTHWHDDHVFGNSVFREEWPGLQIISHVNTRTDAAKQAFGAIKTDVENNKATVAKFEEYLRTGKGSDGTALTEERRRRAEATLRLLKKYGEEVPQVKETLPDLTIDRSLTLQAGTRTIRIEHLGLGNTRGDVVVYLPKEKIVASGDLVVAPVPFGIGSYYAEWADTLGKLQQLDASTILIGHGAVQHDWSAAARVQRLLTDLVARVKTEIAAGATLEAVQAKVTLADWKKELAGDNPLAQRAFDAYFVQPAVERVFRQLRGERLPTED